MTARQPLLPRLWLMTDERMGEALWDAVARLPRGSGVIFRHYALAPGERRALFARVAREARRRRLVLVRAGDQRLAGEQGVHGRAGGLGIHTSSAHSRREALAATRAGANLIFVSPVFPTRSHPGARTLGPLRAALLIRGLGVPAIALGGMTSHQGKRLGSLGFYGWAAIDAWTRQKRKAVPT